MFSATTFEIVVYPESYDCENLEKKLQSFEYIEKYAFALHDKDDNKPHYHIMIQTYYPCDSTRIAKDFHVEENAVEKAQTKKKTHKYDAMCLYLIHKNAPEKFQYDISIVTASFDYAAFIQKHSDKVGKNRRRTEIVDGIQSGHIREYNLHEHITAMEYVQFASAIKNAFAFREKKMNSSKRDMKVIYIMGDSGTGKTTLAKEFAEKQGYDYFISSSSNDLLYGYAGQPCVILDDVRGSLMLFSDWLKMLDNDTNSSVKARYNNKNFSEVKLLIITSWQSIQQFYYDVYDNQNEDIIQLKRRCGTRIRVEKEYYYVSFWDKECNCYTAERSFVNNTYTKFKPSENFVKESLALLGLTEADEVKPKNEFMDITDEQAQQIEMMFGVENEK